ncbi:MAG: alanine dehydrogenase [Clostridiales bacterium]|jgi:alanine dehydrogenase|nr:alanine dehydrogenase [Clostridiales bacterium]
MRIGTVTEIKKHEYRVGLTPDGARAFTEAGHRVYAQAGAGLGSGFTDEEYAARGALILPSAAEVFEKSQMVIKVKEPLPEEYPYLREDLILYTYLHLAAGWELTEAMLRSGVRGVAFETITDRRGGLPCLRPMSEIAGRLSVQEGAKYLEKPFGGAGVLLGGVPGVERGRVAVIGCGAAGANACRVAVGMGAEVTALDVNPERLAYLDDLFGGRITTLYNSPGNLEKTLADADLVIGAVLVAGLAAPKVVRREHLGLLKPGAVLVDIAIDQGGCFETSRVTYHDDPVYIEGGAVHYCVGNMPGAVPRTSTLALANATLGFGLRIAELGLEEACRRDPCLAAGVNTYAGKCTCENVALSHKIAYTPLAEA